jgi:hypothetical protein
MTTQLTAKLTALGVALVVNGMMIVGVGYLFSGQIQESAWLQAQTQAWAPATTGAAA